MSGALVLAPPPGAPTSWATLSPCGRYRYLLGREWDASKPRVLWVMLAGGAL